MPEQSPINRPAPITAIPRGLLSLLGIKSFGRYPQHLSEVLAPVWEIRDHYEASYAGVFLQGPIAQAAGTAWEDVSFGTTIGFVPFNQQAHVLNYTARADLTGLAAVTATPAVFINGIGFQVGDTVTFAAGSLATWGSWGAFWMPPGAALGVMVNLKTAADAIAWYATTRSVVYEG